MSSHPSAAGSVDTTVYPVVFAVALGHFLNDLMQSLIPASYPLLQSNFALSFTQIGLITLVFQGTGSVFQPFVGLYTDRFPKPFALPMAMLVSGLGLVALANARSFEMVLLSVALVGFGSAIFHPEASRIARLAAGKRPGFSQSMFQVGGNAGTAFGPLAAAWILIGEGQITLQNFAAIAFIGLVLLTFVRNWYVKVGALRLQARKSRAANTVALSPQIIRKGMSLLIILMMSKFIFTVSFSSYYTFFLMENYGVDVKKAQHCLFIYLAAVAAGTIIGGPIGDKIGRRRVILWSILGILPLTLIMPWLPFVPSVICASVAGLILASAFPAMVVYAQDLMPKHTGMVAGLLFGLAFGIAGIGAAGLGVVADVWGIVTVYKLCAFVPVIGVLAIFLPNPRITV